MFLPHEAGAFGNNIEKKPQKPKATPKIEKLFISSILQKIFELSAIQCKWQFFAKMY